MGFEQINNLREKYNHRDLMNELDYGRRANHRGYTNAVQAEFLNWLCDAAYQRIQVLEQMDVLDKIRAEIEENINYNKKMNYQGIVAGLLLTLNIINKYRKETGND